MSPETWSAVDSYFREALLPRDPVLEAVLLASRTAGLPDIELSPLQAAFLQVLVRTANARRVLELGTLGGYSGTCICRALPPGGRLTTVELSRQHAAIARENFRRAGVDSQVDLIEGPALDVLQRLVEAGTEPFDVIFIDADKPNNKPYFQWALKLSRPGTLIVVDNVVRRGQVVLADGGDERVAGVRALVDHLRSEPRVTATCLQTVGSKGYDGMILATVL